MSKISALRRVLLGRHATVKVAKTSVFSSKRACAANQKHNCRASNWFSRLESTTVNTYSEFQLDVLSSCRDTGVGKWFGESGEFQGSL